MHELDGAQAFAYIDGVVGGCPLDHERGQLLAPFLVSIDLSINIGSSGGLRSCIQVSQGAHALAPRGQLMLLIIPGCEWSLGGYS